MEPSSHSLERSDDMARLSWELPHSTKRDVAVAATAELNRLELKLLVRAHFSYLSNLNPHLFDDHPWSAMLLDS